MIKHKKGALRVESHERRHFISVPAGRALDLHYYLRSNRIPSAPPEPSFDGVDCIELPRTIDVDAVQTLLNAWS